MRGTARPGAALALALLAATARAQAPVPILEAIDPPGGVPGAVVRVTLLGRDLEPVEALWFEAAGFTATPGPALAAAADEKKDGEKKKRRRRRGEERPPPTQTWDIRIAAEVPPGLYDLRAVNRLGLSAPRAFHVSPVPMAPVRDARDGEPLAIEPGQRFAGRLEEGEVDRFRFRAPRSERLIVECLGERLDSMVDATLLVRDGDGRAVASARDQIGLDPALAFDAREGSEYTVEIWDFAYRGTYPYLLQVASVPRVLFAFPPIVPGGEGITTFHGWNLPGGTGAAPLEALAAPVTAAPPGEHPLIAYHPTAALLDGMLEARPAALACEPILLLRSALPASIEAEPNDAPGSAAKISPPCGLSGHFDTPRDRDWYAFRARKDERFEIEVTSARLGAACDPLLLIARRETREPPAAAPAVQDLVFLDEREVGFPREDAIRKKFVAPERDPVALWTAPEDGEYLVQVRNRNGRSGPEAFYHLAIAPPRPRFTLVAIHAENESGEAPVVPRGGSQSCDVLIERHGGFEGPIEVTAEGLPPGLSAAPVFAGPGEEFVPLVFTATSDAPPWAGGVRVTGTAAWKGETLRASASYAVMVYGGRRQRHPFQYVHSRFTNSLALAIRDPAPFTVTLEAGAAAVSPGAKVAFTARVTRGEGFKEAVQVALTGLGTNAYPNDEGRREARATIGADKSEERIEIEVRNDARYGERTCAAYVTADVEYPEDPFDPAAARKEKRRTTFISNPVTVRVVPPFRLGAAETARAGALRIEVERAPGLRPEEDLPVRLAVRTAAGREKDYQAVHRRGTSGILLDAAPLAGEDGRIAFPLQVRLTVRIKDGDVQVEETVAARGE
jgi:hypothetical protein